MRLFLLIALLLPSIVYSLEVYEDQILTEWKSKSVYDQSIFFIDKTAYECARFYWKTEYHNNIPHLMRKIESDEGELVMYNGRCYSL